MSASIPLTRIAHGAGCGCKLSALELQGVMRSVELAGDPRLVVGSGSGDDAAVFRVSDGLALVQTVDFFTPLVDDPYDFGRIAATNALSDVYAMGGRPLTALNVVAWPRDRLDVLPAVLQGGADVVTAAGGVVVGGHSIEDAEPKYGLAVTGVLENAPALTNAGAVAGDVLVLTKPLGTGAIVTARCGGAPLEQAIRTMTTLNRGAAAAARAADAHALTDVTGFGLLGHLHRLASESGLAAVLDAAAVPVIAGVEDLLASERGISGGSRRNREHAERFTRWRAEVPEWRRWLLADATTSGGLLVAVAPEAAASVPGDVVGGLTEGVPGAVVVR